MNRLPTVAGLDAFLDVLRTNRFPVGLDHRLRLLQAFDNFKGEYTPYRLRTLLCPLFATNAEEQRLFYELFDTHFPHFSPPGLADEGGEATSVDRSTEKKTTKSAAIQQMLWVLVVLFQVTLAALALSIWHFRDPGPPDFSRFDPVAPAWSLSPPFQPPDLKPPVKNEIEVVSAEIPWLPTASMKPFAKLVQPSQTWRWSALVLLPVLLWIVMEFGAWYRRRAILARGTGEDSDGSYVSPMTLSTGAYVKGDFAATLRRLRRPATGPLRLHLARTISATIRTAGFPAFRYQSLFRRPEYLALIDRASARDHQAIFFQELVKGLSRRGLRVAAYFFSGDPRVCHSITSRRSSYLADLFRQAGDHRLILFGEGDHLVSEWGDVTPAGSLLLRWHQRCILTPRQTNDWRQRELQLARHFLLLPATTAFLAASVDYFDPDRSARLRSPVSRFDHREPDFDRASPAEIRRFLADDAVYIWLCACALYPQLQWDITLRLGGKLDSGLLTEANIEKLVRLPWFRRGSLPRGLQQALAESLDEVTRRRLRAVILELLEETGPTSEVSTDDGHRLEIAVQHLDILPDDRRRILDDEAVARVVAGHKIPPFALAIPSALRRILFPYGVPALGFRARARHALLSFGLLAVIGVAGFAWYSTALRPLGQVGMTIGAPGLPPFWSQRSTEAQTARLTGVGAIPLWATLSGHGGYVWQAAFSSDGQRIVTASQDATAKVWDAASGKTLVTLAGHKGPVTQAAFSPDGQSIATASQDTTARVWDAGSGKVLLTLAGHEGPVVQAVFSPDGQRIVTASADKTARVWNAANGQELATLFGHTDSLSGAAFSPDGQRVVTASRDQTARVWDVARGRVLATLYGHTGAVWDAAFSPDGKLIVTASADGTARVWDAASGQVLATLSGHTAAVGHAAFSPDGKRIVTASDDDTARVWDAANGQLLAILSGHVGVVEYAAFSPDARNIVTASADRTARVWGAPAWWQRLTPQQQNHIRHDILPKWRQMPPERRRAVWQRLLVLQNMPESARNQRLNDPNFTRGMSEEDKATLHDLSHLHVDGSPEMPLSPAVPLEGTSPASGGQAQQQVAPPAGGQQQGQTHPPIKHLIVVMMENRSFDHMLGFLASSGYPIDGLTGSETNFDTTGALVRVQPLATYQGQANPDPGHTWQHVNMQIFGNAKGVDDGTPKMNGFVKDYFAQQQNLGHSHIVMYGFAPDKVPVLTTLAREFAVCDRWFSSVPGPELPNHAFANFGTSFGRVDNRLISVPDPTFPSIYERFESQGRSAKIYYYDQQSRSMAPAFLQQKHPELFATFEQFLSDSRSGNLPDYSFVEPNYSDHSGSSGIEIASDDHPDHNVLVGENFIARVYNAIRDNEALWRDSVLLITFSTHGGFYDHVLPPETVNPDGLIDEATGFDFQRLGVRVPTIIVSPYIAKGSIDHTVYDHASILATAAKFFLNSPRNGASKRELNSVTFDHVLLLPEPRTDAPVLRLDSQK
jgi:phospholipase C